MYSYDHAKMSKYDMSNWTRQTLSYVDKADPILNSLGWPTIPKSTILVFLVVGETFSSVGLRLEVEEESSFESCYIYSSSMPYTYDVYKESAYKKKSSSQETCEY